MFVKGHKMSEETKNKIRIARARQVMTEEQKRNKSLSMMGEKHFAWKGGISDYFCKHVWIAKKLGSANHCEDCGLDKIPEGKKRYFQWANISRKYLRDINDWKQLCIKCHCKFDIGCGRGKRGKSKPKTNS